MRAILICGTLLLGACTQTVPATSGASLGGAVGAAVGSTAGGLVSQENIDKFKAAMIKGCKYEPATAFAAKLLDTVTGYPIFTDPIATLADKGCAAVTGAYAQLTQEKKPVEKKTSAEEAVVDPQHRTVNGVPVKGRFVEEKKENGK